MKNRVVLIHGAWLNSASWAGFRARYEAAGHAVLAPDWPHDNRSPAELRASPDPLLAGIGQNAIIDHYAAIIAALPAPPILIGHSLGGVFVQHLLDRGLGAAGVVINPAPTPGVPLGPHSIRSALPVFLTPFGWRKTLHMSQNTFRTRFAQTAPESEKPALYDRYIVPTPGKVYWDGILRPIKINWENPNRAPMLLIGGERDLIADASMTRAIHAKHKKSPVRTDLQIFPNRSHWICLETGWEEVADLALGWAVTHQR